MFPVLRSEIIFLVLKNDFWQPKNSRVSCPDKTVYTARAYDWRTTRAIRGGISRAKDRSPGSPF
jgi:hypothetical protein